MDYKKLKKATEGIDGLSVLKKTHKKVDYYYLRIRSVRRGFHGEASVNTEKSLKWDGKTGSIKNLIKAGLRIREELNIRTEKINSPLDSFKRLIDLWYKSKKDVPSFGQKKVMLNKRLRPFWDDIKIKDFSYDLVQKWVDETKVSHPRAINNTYGMLKDFLRFAKINNLLDYDGERLPKVKVTVSKKSRAKLTNEEYEIFLDSIKNCKLHPFYKTTFETGLRGQEVCALTWGDWNAEEGTLYVSKAVKSDDNFQPYIGELKNYGEPRKVFISEELNEYLRNYLKEKIDNIDSVEDISKKSLIIKNIKCPMSLEKGQRVQKWSTSEILTPRIIASHVRYHLKDIDVPAALRDKLMGSKQTMGVGAHTGRVNFATKASKYLNQFELQKMLGHKDLQSTAIYYQPDEEEMKESYKKLKNLYKNP
jgi:integrase